MQSELSLDHPQLRSGWDCVELERRAVYLVGQAGRPLCRYAVEVWCGAVRGSGDLFIFMAFIFLWCC